VPRALWPWLKDRGYATTADDAVLEEFLAILGRRAAHLRPGLRLLRRWNSNAAVALGASRELAVAIRSAVNGLLRATGEPVLPVSSRR
jgi:hypothetical protein